MVKISAVVIILALLVSSALAQGTNTTGVNCTATPTHTLCQYPGQNPSCSIVNNVIDPSVQNYIVNLHNITRATVAAGLESRGNPGPQPAAASMPPLNWNPNLALVAQRWSDQCTFSTDAYRNTALQAGQSPQYVGQNVYAYIDYAYQVPAYTNATQQMYWRQAISRWYNEVVSYNQANVGSYFYNPNTGKYTQIVWGATTDIGCGFTQWNYQPNNRVARMLVCNYGPGGNKVGDPVYIRA